MTHKIDAQYVCDMLNDAISKGCNLGELSSKRISCDMEKLEQIKSDFMFGQDGQIGLVGVLNGLVGNGLIAHCMPENTFVVIK